MKKTSIVFLAVALVLGMMGGEVLAARSGGTFNFCSPYGGQVYGLDPHRSTRCQDRIIELNINRSLYKWDAETNKPVLALAEKVDASSDGKVYTYTLKKNIKFHNGRKLTVDDIIWSYERIMSPKLASPAATFIRFIKGAKEMEDGKADKISGLRKIDDYTLEISLVNPVDPAYNLYQIAAAILPHEEVEKKGDGFTTDPVGCGPFQFEKWTKGSEVVLKKFPGFYKNGKPYLDKVVFKIMGESAARDIAFRAKELDATIVGSSQYQEYQKDPKLSKNLIEVAEMFTRLIVFNLEYKPFTDKRVRQAINYSINSPLIIDKYLKGKAFPCVSFLPTTSPAFDANAKGYEYDLEKAKELMKAAGYEKGFTVDVLCTSSKSWGVGVVEALIPFLKKINITVTPRQVEGAVMAVQARKGEFQALIWSLESGPDPLQALMRFHATNPRSSGNYPGYNNPEYDKLLDAAAKERNEMKKVDLLKKANAIFMEDAPIWFFNYNKAIIAYHPWVHGIKSVAPEMMYQELADVWMDAH
jgi:peptide/nickel transport system substrate-binding protein